MSMYQAVLSGGPADLHDMVIEIDTPMDHIIIPRMREQQVKHYDENELIPLEPEVGMQNLTYRRALRMSAKKWIYRFDEEASK